MLFKVLQKGSDKNVEKTAEVEYFEVQEPVYRIEYKSETRKLSLISKKANLKGLITLPLRAMIMSSAPRLKALQTLNYKEEKNMKWEEVEKCH